MANLSLQSTHKLLSGYEIPVVGLGVCTPVTENLQIVNKMTLRCSRFIRRMELSQRDVNNFIANSMY